MSSGGTGWSSTAETDQIRIRSELRLANANLCSLPPTPALSFAHRWRSRRGFANVANGEDDAPDDGEKKMKNGRTLYADNARIRPKVRGNPAREGTHSYACFELAKTAKTFGAYRLAGGNLKYLYWFRDREKLEIVV
jgi:hypothetical protein